MAIEKIAIKDFTVFEDIEIEFAKGINVFIGENGTGKTHLLKLLYIHDALVNDVMNMIIYPLEVEGWYVIPKTLWNAYFEPDLQSRAPDCMLQFSDSGFISNIVLIPAKDMLTHSRGFLSLNNDRYMPFDKTLYDIISKAQLPNLREIPVIAKCILPKLEKIIGGIVVVKNEVFFIEHPDGTLTPFSLEAEGIKKLGLLWQLLMNGSITEGTVLHWDEPEANINPKLIPVIVDILLELSRQGVQVFLATHDYTLAKYFEVKMTYEDDVRFHALYKPESGEGVKVETQKKFSTLENNSIIQESIRLYKEEVKKVMG